MSYTLDEKLDIGKKIYTHEMTYNEAIAKYDVCKGTLENYVQMFKEKNGLAGDKGKADSKSKDLKKVKKKSSSTTELDEYMAMSKEELVRELLLAKANELRAKKGYEVKGAGANKEFVPLNNKNSKS